MYVTYVLKSLKDNRRYIGYTSDIKRRLSEHNNGKVFATRNRIPLILIYQEKYSDKNEAIKREKFFKTHKGYNVLKVVIDN